MNWKVDSGTKIQTKLRFASLLKEQVQGYFSRFQQQREARSNYAWSTSCKLTANLQVVILGSKVWITIKPYNMFYVKLSLRSVQMLQLTHGAGAYDDCTERITLIVKC